mmetsp:Transcript_33141/g.98615  ORF Transcript_33141/g.98615 Transcript_33141/m.98615 type:complete len:225 (+) Transcript_33141:688-1362(+)
MACNWHVEVHLAIGVVRLVLAQVPVDTRAAQQWAAGPPVPCLRRCHDTHVNGALLPDAVARQQLLNFVHARRVLACPVVNVLEQADREVLRHATHAEVGRMHARTRHTLVKLEKLLALLKCPQKRRERADVHCMTANGQQVVKNAGDLAVQHADVLGAQRHVHIKQLLHGQDVGMLHAHHRHVIEAVEVRDGLEVRLVLDELFGATVEEANVWVSARDDLAVHL